MFKGDLLPEVEVIYKLKQEKNMILNQKISEIESKLKREKNEFI